MKIDIYNEVTERIIAQLEQGVIPWHKPWVGANDCAISHATGKPYSMLNQFLLGLPGEYLTFNQCKAEGGRIKKGAKAKIIVFWNMIKTVKDEDDEEMEEVRMIPILKYFNVFHIDDCEGIKPRKNTDLPPVSAQPDEVAESILTDYIQRENIDFENTLSDRAFYRPATDSIRLPMMTQFEDTAEYYSTAFHEATHSTGHESRLDRFEKNAAAAAFGSAAYSKEELTAEIGAACLLHHAGLETPESFQNSAAYIQGWLKALHDDKRLIVSAASRAEKAVKYILNITDENDD